MSVKPEIENYEFKICFLVTHNCLADNSCSAQAQQPAKLARIGYLVAGSLESPGTRVLLDPFRQGIRERGYVEGQNYAIECRAADGKIERFPGLATELARIMATSSSRLIRQRPTAQQATTTIPITSAMGSSHRPARLLHDIGEADHE